jgi:hypothetical protein
MSPARANAVSPEVEAGNIYLPSGQIPAPAGYEQTLTELFVEECAAIPNGAHDDQVDAMTQALLRLSGADTGQLPRWGIAGPTTATSEGCRPAESDPPRRPHLRRPMARCSGGGGDGNDLGR